MAKLRVMYWKEVPVQVQGEDDSGPVSVPLDDRFQKGVDAISMLDGSAGSDEYMDAWSWGEYREMDGGARAAAEAAAEQINRDFPRDFVARVRALQSSGHRDPTPGAIDHWSEDGKD
jgi:hypothetical protein